MPPAATASTTPARGGPLLLRFLVLAGALSLSACILLTGVQTTAVDNFSKAATGYSRIPSATLTSFAALTETLGVLKASTADARDARDSLQKLNHALKAGELQGKDAETLTQALGIIETYATGLTTLVSSTETTALDANATALGTSLDGALTEYGTLAHRSSTALTSASNIFVGVAAGVAGLAVGAAQLQYLRNFTKAADPEIQKLATDVVRILDTMDAVADNGRVQIGLLPDGGVLTGSYETHFPPTRAPLDMAFLELRIRTFLEQQKLPEARVRSVSEEAALKLFQDARSGLLDQDAGAGINPEQQDARATLEGLLSEPERARLPTDGGSYPKLLQELVYRPALSPISTADVSLFATALLKIDEVKSSVATARKATAAVVMLHAALRKAVEPGAVTLDSLIAEGQVIGNQVAAGGKIISALNADGGAPSPAATDADAGTP